MKRNIKIQIIQRPINNAILLAPNINTLISANVAIITYSIRQVCLCVNPRLIIR